MIDEWASFCCESVLPGWLHSKRLRAVSTDPWGAFQGELPCVKEARARLANHNEAVARTAREKRPKPKAPEIDMAAYESCAKASNAERSYFRYAFFQLSVMTGVFGGISAIWGPKAVGALFKKL